MKNLILVLSIFFALNMQAQGGG